MYAATRRTTEAAAATLRAGGLQAAAYHAGLEDAERTRVQDAFAAGSLPIVCATNAFGMGIDRPDVDTVVHFAIPGSMEAYYQEIGRAGRDGRAATATLLWDYADVATREFLIDSPRRAKPGTASELDAEEPSRRRAIDHEKLQRMIDYAETGACLRAAILRYFGDPAIRNRCGNCGNCQPRSIDAHDRELVRKILSGIARAGERVRPSENHGDAGRGHRRAATTAHVALDNRPAAGRAGTVGGALNRCRCHGGPHHRLRGQVPQAGPDRSRA